MAHGKIDAADEARQIQAPTLVVTGEVAKIIPMAWTRRPAILVPGARFEILEGASQVAASVQDPRLLKLVSAFSAEQGVPFDEAG